MADEQRRSNRQTDEAREAMARAMFEHANPDLRWSDGSEQSQNFYRDMADVGAQYDSRVDTWPHIHRVRCLLDHVVTDLIVRGQQHDQSKLVSPEREAFDEFTPKLKGLTYGSDEYRATLDAMRPALSHHYEQNSHHPEHFGVAGIEGMTLLDVIEMLCDWKAATERHDDGDLRRSIELNTKRFGLSAQLAGMLVNTAEAMGWIA